MKSEYLTQYALEFELAKCLEFGTEVKLAERLGVSPGLVSQYLNCNDSRESPIYKAAAMLAEWIAIDPDGGRRALELFNLFVQRALPHDDALCPNATRERAFKETMEAQLSEASDADLETCIREYEESQAATKDHIAALRAEQRRRVRRDVFETVNGKLNGNGGKVRAMR